MSDAPPVPVSVPAAAADAVGESFRASWVWPGLLVLLGIVAYANSLSTPFVFDDHKWIVGNADLRSLSDLPRVLGDTNRPLLKLSLALNYAAGGLEVRGYHVVNLTIHLLAGLLLFGIVRRTLEGPSLRARFGGDAAGLAFAVAALWLVHPLQTQAVTYVVQRGESLMGLFYFATLYSVIRLADVERAAWWTAAGVIACVLGMATKPVMVAAPLVVLLYDRCFLAGSFAGALRERGVFFAGLSASWGVLAWVVADLAEGAGSIVSPPVEYAMTQAGVVAYYLRLTIWPDPLCLDYYWLPAQSLSEVALPGLLIAGLLVATGYALWRAPAAGFLGAWFFLILAPTSSVLPIADPAFEHRMYLPLAAPLAAIVLGAHQLLRRAGARPRVGVALFVCVAVIFTALTIRRNSDYRSGLVMWQSVIELAPHNPRAHYSLANMYRLEDEHELAIVHYRRAIELRPDYTDAYSNLGNVLRRTGDFDGAIAAYRGALAIDPDYVNALANLGNSLREQGNRQEAVKLYRRALELQPNSAQIHHNMAMALAAGGHASDAIAHLLEAIRLRPYNPLPCGNIARILSRLIGRGLTAPKGAHDTMQDAQLFRALADQYATANMKRMTLEAESVARALAAASVRQRTGS